MGPFSSFYGRTTGDVKTTVGLQLKTGFSGYSISLFITKLYSLTILRTQKFTVSSERNLRHSRSFDIPKFVVCDMSMWVLFDISVKKVILVPDKTTES